MLREFEVVSILSLVVTEISQSTVVSEEGFPVPVIRVLEPRALALVGIVPPVAIDVVVYLVAYPVPVVVAGLREAAPPERAAGLLLGVRPLLRGVLLRCLDGWVVVVGVHVYPQSVPVVVEPVPLVERQVVVRVEVTVVVVVRVPEVYPPVPVEVRGDHVQVGDLKFATHLPALVPDVVVHTIVDPQPPVGVFAPAPDRAVLDYRA